MLAAGFDAGIRYDEKLEQDMIAVPIGPRVQRFVTAASPAYLAAHSRPTHPKDLLDHACIRHRFASGTVRIWEFERDGEIVKVNPSGPLTASTSSSRTVTRPGKSSSRCAASSARRRAKRG